MTGLAPYVIMRNVNDQELIQKVITKTGKTRNKIKEQLIIMKKTNSKNH